MDFHRYYLEHPKLTVKLFKDVDHEYVIVLYLFKFIFQIKKYTLFHYVFETFILYVQCLYI